MKSKTAKLKAASAEIKNRFSTAKVVKQDETKGQDYEITARTTIEEMISVVDMFFKVSPFEIAMGNCGAHAGDVVFGEAFNVTNPGKFEFDNWMLALLPGHKERRRQVEAERESIGEKIETMYPSMVRQWNEYNAESDGVVSDAQEFGIDFGILIGLKWAGLSRAEILDRAEGLIAKESSAYPPVMSAREERKNRKKLTA